MSMYLGKQLVATMIAALFESEVGKFQSRAMLIRFATKIDHSKEEGYRYYDIALHAAHNYVGVYGRAGWDVIPLEGLTDDEDPSIKKGYDYSTGADPFKCFGYHDSGWRSMLESMILDLWPTITGFTTAKQSDFNAEGFVDKDFYMIVYADDLKLPSPR